jgi:Cu(I)/Ag(I) efflux system membrane protein CusA/SilA
MSSYPTGYFISWSGQYENQQRARSRLLLVVPVVLLIIFGLLYVTYHSVLEAAHVLLAVFPLHLQAASF